MVIMGNFSLCAVLQDVDGEAEAPARATREQMICKAICLGIAYSSSIGGISTLPGTSPNLIFSEYINE